MIFHQRRMVSRRAEEPSKINGAAQRPDKIGEKHGALLAVGKTPRMAAYRSPHIGGFRVFDLLMPVFPPVASGLGAEFTLRPIIESITSSDMGLLVL